MPPVPPAPPLVTEAPWSVAVPPNPPLLEPDAAVVPPWLELPLAAVLPPPPPFAPVRVLPVVALVVALCVDMEVATLPPAEEVASTVAARPELAG
jgi:hypothetical protein